jgi:phenylalanyl-tRNA synthetase beta subunit
VSGWWASCTPACSRNTSSRTRVAFEMLTDPLLEGLAPRFRGLSRMPAVRRDYAFTVAETPPWGPSWPP